MLYTNTKQHGGDFESAFSSQMEVESTIRIASGYFSLDILKKYESSFIERAENYSCKVLLGMAFYEGLSQKQYDSVNEINEQMIAMGTDSGFFVTNGRKYHGKIFQLNGETYLGSSNFSSSGFRGNIEATIHCSDDQVVSIDAFLDDLFSDEFSIPIHNAVIPIKGKRKAFEGKSKLTWEGLNRHQLVSSSPEILYDQCIATFDLLEKAKTEKSNFNVFFGKGRLNSKTGVVSPRPWYEIEFIIPKSITSNPDYPKGDLTVYTDDGYILPMKTSGTNYKNLRTKGGLLVLGRWFKGQLEKSGVLEKYEPITPSTFLEYGKTKLSLYKMTRDNCFYMRFED